MSAAQDIFLRTSSECSQGVPMCVYIYIEREREMIQPIAFGVSFNLNFQSNLIGLFSTEPDKRDVETRLSIET